MPPKAKFADGERVLCFHGPLIYEAKALRSQLSKDKIAKYLIHYAGWNKNWDEWVPENRVLKYNESNVLRQKDLWEQQNPSKKGKNPTVKLKKSDTSASTTKDTTDSRGSTPSKELLKENSASVSASRSKSSKISNAVYSDDVAMKKRPRIDQTTESEEQFTAKVEVKIRIPDELKSWLVDDWEAINRQHKLVDLPAKPSVQDIIDSYIQFKKSSKTTMGKKETAMYDVTTGIIEYFNVTLGSQLLYKFERPQYSDLLADQIKVPMSQIYGSFHLLRLFVKMGGMLSFTTLSEKQVQLLLIHIQDFLKYLSKNNSSLFNMQNFVNVPSEYLRRTTT